MPEDEPIHAQETIAPLKIPLSMTGRLAAAMGLVAAVAFLFALFLKPGATHLNVRRAVGCGAFHHGVVRHHAFGHS